jgi:hypothetical protein
MDSMKEMLFERVEWIKEKGYWLLIVVLSAATFFMTALCITSFTMFVFQPENYKSTAFPEFQTKEHDGFKLVAILENSFLKSEFCSLEEYANTGRSINQEEYCTFNYQTLPEMRRSFDVTLYGLNPMDIRFATVCLLKFPRGKPQRFAAINESEAINSAAHVRNRYVCQKYRAYNKIHIINDMQTDELIFMEIELELTQKGYDSLEFLDLQLEFEEERSSAMRFLINHYMLISIGISLGVAIWSGIVSFIMGVGIIVYNTLR